MKGAAAAGAASGPPLRASWMVLPPPPQLRRHVSPSVGSARRLPLVAPSTDVVIACCSTLIQLEYRPPICAEALSPEPSPSLDISFLCSRCSLFTVVVWQALQRAVDVGDPMPLTAGWPSRPAMTTESRTSSAATLCAPSRWAPRCPKAVCWHRTGQFRLCAPYSNVGPAVTLISFVRCLSSL